MKKNLIYLIISSAVMGVVYALISDRLKVMHNKRNMRLLKEELKKMSR